MIKKCLVKDCEFTQKTFLAPYVGYTVFIINNEHIILDDEIITEE